MNNKAQIGLIGLGLLGSALAERLLAENFEVIGYDVSSDAQAALKEQGGTVANSAQEVVQQTDRFILCLPNSNISREVIDEVEPMLSQRHTLIDVTTGHPEEMAAMGVRLAEKGIHYLDATVGGSSQQTRDHQAVIMVGAEPELLEANQDLFDALSRQTFHVGPCGAGARMKLVVNLVLGLNRAVLAEGLAFAAQYDFNLEQTLEILKAGPAYSLAMDIKGEKMIKEDFVPQARLKQHLKDVRLILEVAEKQSLELPLSEVHRELLESAAAKGYADSDNSAVIKAYPLPESKTDSP